MIKITAAALCSTILLQKAIAVFFKTIPLLQATTCLNHDVCVFVSFHIQTFYIVTNEYTVLV